MVSRPTVPADWKGSAAPRGSDPLPKARLTQSTKARMMVDGLPVGWTTGEAQVAFVLTARLTALLVVGRVGSFSRRLLGLARCDEWKTHGYYRGLAGGKDEPEPYRLSHKRSNAVRELKWWFKGYREGLRRQKRLGVDRLFLEEELRQMARFSTTEGLCPTRPCPIPRKEWDQIKSKIYSRR